MHERRQKCGAQMLNDERGVVAREIVGRLERDVMQHEGADDAVNDGDDQLVQILRAQSLRDAQQPFHVLAVGRITGVLGLRPVVVHATRERLQGEHTHAVSGEEGAPLLVRERLILSVYLLQSQNSINVEFFCTNIVI